MSNPFAVTKQDNSAITESQASRQIAEVQAMMVIAKKFPRDEAMAYDRIMTACQRISLAENALYEYPKGGKRITGPSIRLAEAMAQSWGNMDFGIIELNQRKGESDMMAYAWDLETNTKQTKIFTVKHIRATKKGDYDLSDPRDIYETTANQGARRLRACILGIIPGDVTDSAVHQCEKTLMSGESEPIEDRIKKMLHAFKKEFQVSKEMIETRFQCNAESFTEHNMLDMKKIYRSMKDGMSSREDHFSTEKKESKPSSLENAVNNTFDAVAYISTSPITQDEYAAFVKEHAMKPANKADVDYVINTILTEKDAK